MGSSIFWIVILLIVIVLLVSNANRMKKERVLLEKKIEESFGAVNTPGKDDSLIDNNIKAYLELSDTRESAFCIDDITWNDLNMNVVFNMLNRTYSSPGEEYLYKRLHMMYLDGNTSYKFYDDANKLCDDVKTRNSICLELAKLSKLKGKSYYEIIIRLFEAKSKSIIKDIILVAIFIASMFLIFVSPGIGFIAFLIMLGVLMNTYFKGKASMDENLRAFCYTCNLIKSAKSIKQILGDEFSYDESLTDILKWSFLISKKDGTSSNPLDILLDYIRIIFHVDLIVYNLRLAKIIENKDKIISLYESIGYLDSVIAVSSYFRSMLKYCKASINENVDGIHATGMYHPLNRKPVCNDIDGNGGVLITGSNASGKSTFLKTVGLNVIFAQSFGMALADDFSIKPFKLYSSMALNDNILGEESYYVVESKSLKRIYDATIKDKNVLCIIDEVLRGTNTTERIAASTTILGRIRDNNAMCFVATHDTELTILLKDKYDLYYFTEIVEDGKVTFPYLINKGISSEGNAIRLLDMLGFDEDIISKASILVANYKELGKWENN